MLVMVMEEVIEVMLVTEAMVMESNSMFYFQLFSAKNFAIKFG